MSLNHLVTTVVPAYNAAGTIQSTLESVQAQTYRSQEIIVVDDGSVDGTASLVLAMAENDSRIRLITQRNAGVAAARNAAIAQAAGNWIATIDADDLWHPEKLARQMDVAQSATIMPGLVYCWSRLIDVDDLTMADFGCTIHRGQVFDQLFATNFFNNASSALMRRDAVIAAGCFDTSLRAMGAQGAEDLALYLAIARREPVEIALGFLTGYRQSAGSMSRNPARMRSSIEIVLQRFELAGGDIPASLSRLARMNYDFYAGSLAISGGDWPTVASYLGRAMKRAPGPALALLACSLVWRIDSRLAGRLAPKAFLDLHPDERIRKPLSDWHVAYQARTVRRLTAAVPPLERVEGRAER